MSKPSFDLNPCSHTKRYQFRLGLDFGNFMMTMSVSLLFFFLIVTASVALDGFPGNELSHGKDSRFFN